MEEKQYKIGRITYTQEELTWEKDQKLYSLFKKGLNIADGDESVTLDKLVMLLFKYNLMGVFLDIILIPKTWLDSFLKNISRLRNPTRPGIEIKKAGNAQIEQICHDFFLLNQRLMIMLFSLSENSDLIVKIQEILAAGASPQILKPKTSQKSEKKEAEPNAT